MWVILTDREQLREGATLRFEEDDRGYIIRTELQVMEILSDLVKLVVFREQGRKLQLKNRLPFTKTMLQILEEKYLIEES